MSEPPPAEAACLERTRSAVLNVLMAVGLGIAVGGWFLGRRDRGALLVSPRAAEQVAHAVLVILIVASYATRRAWGSRARLRDPATRARRFYAAHVAGSVLGALAVPLGIAFGAAIRPTLEAVAPFWVAALALGFLSLPRASELDDFDEPLPAPDEPTP